ncbi:antibiotic resistance protein MarC [Burkholderia pseudomallei]|nr:antibiotic resistance protein MarC [Burkholderia pseudomallei]
MPRAAARVRGQRPADARKRDAARPSRPRRWPRKRSRFFAGGAGAFLYHTDWSVCGPRLDRARRHRAIGGAPPMTRPSCPAGALEAVETASRDERRALQRARLKGALRRASDHVAHYQPLLRCGGRASGDVLKTLADRARVRAVTRVGIGRAVARRKSCAAGCQMPNAGCKARAERHEAQRAGPHARLLRSDRLAGAGAPRSARRRVGCAASAKRPPASGG